MKTVTFYSYKGGVGRTLLLANVAKYLVQFGQKVFALDFDLEAPGLHYKLNLLSGTDTGALRQGLVDYIYHFVDTSEPPVSLQEYVIKLETQASARGELRMMPAGNVLASSYWKRLAKISWHDLFYEERSEGVAFFLYLKARIQEDFAPDFLLIDSRTGITEVAGVATTIMPDDVVCLLLRNKENMEGAREVLRSIKRTRRERKQEPINIIPVIARLPVLEDPDEERKIVSEIQSFLNQEASDLADTLAIEDLPVLHSERAIEVQEAILIDADKPIDESPLLRDYILLFSHIFPQQLLEREIETLIRHAMDKDRQDSAGVEITLLSLTQRSMHPKALQALLDFYKQQPESKGKILWAASRYWQLTGNSQEPLLHTAVEENFRWDAVRKNFQSRDDERHVPIEFINQVWRAKARASNDIEFGLNLANAFRSLNNPTQASRVIEDLVRIEGIPGNAVIKCLEILLDIAEFDLGLRIVEQFKGSLTDNVNYQMAWAKLLVACGDRSKIARALASKELQVETIKHNDMILYAELLHPTDRAEAALEVMRIYINDAPIADLYYQIMQGRRQVIKLGQLYKKYGIVEEFEKKVRKDLEPRDAARVLQEIGC